MVPGCYSTRSGAEGLQIKERPQSKTEEESRELTSQEAIGLSHAHQHACKAKPKKPPQEVPEKSSLASQAIKVSSRPPASYNSEDEGQGDPIVSRAICPFTIPVRIMAPKSGV